MSTLKKLDDELKSAYNYEAECSKEQSFLIKVNKENLK